jgi:hypothetical protein
MPKTATQKQRPEKAKMPNKKYHINLKPIV